MAGAIGGMLIAEIVGHVLQWTGSYMVPFFIAASAYLVGLSFIHLLSPKLIPHQWDKCEVMYLDAFQLTGKNALVTGSRRGLGAAIAVALAEAGANVGCHGRDPNPGISCDAISSPGAKRSISLEIWRTPTPVAGSSKKPSRSLAPSIFW